VVEVPWTYESTRALRSGDSRYANPRLSRVQYGNRRASVQLQPA
jgi:hypothetical protein